MNQNVIQLPHKVRDPATKRGRQSRAGPDQGHTEQVDPPVEGRGYRGS